MVVNMSNKKIHAVVRELCFRCKKLNISLVFVTQSYFSFPKDAKLVLSHYLVLKINNKKELQNLAINHFADVD